MRRVVLGLLLVVPLLLVAVASDAPRRGASDVGKYLFDPGGRVRAVRTADVDADGRLDLVVLLEEPGGAGNTLLVLRTPAAPVKRRFYPADHVTRIPCRGALAQAGAVAVGRFGPAGEVRLRLLGPTGIAELRPDGGRAHADASAPAARRLAETRTLFGRSPGRALVFWDAVADLDGDGLDELWLPLASGNAPMQVLAGRAADDRLLALEAKNLGASSEASPLERHAFVPNLFPADLDGDGRYELVALRDTELIAWPFTPGVGAGSTPVEPGFRLPLPFLAPDTPLGPEEVRTPRIQLADVDADGTADLLVTLIAGNRTRIESMRTILFHYPGPVRDARTGALVSPRARIDTRSIVHHPSFLDVDADGDLDYVGDSIRGTRWDLIARVMGKDPLITFVGFRFDAAAGTFERAPYFTVSRVYPASEALSNRFGRNGWFAGDFDGDGHADLLDLGNLTSAGVQRAARQEGQRAGDPIGFDEVLLEPVPVKEGLVADAVVADLNGDARADAVLWSQASLFLVVSGGGR